MNRLLMIKVRAMLEQASVPGVFWSKALKHAETLHNCTVSNALIGITPHGSLFGTAPDNSKLRVFGCAAYIHLDKGKTRSTFRYHTQCGVHLRTKNGIRRVNLFHSNRVVRSKHLHLDEKSLPAATIVQEDYQNVRTDILNNTPDVQESLGCQVHLEDEVVPTYNGEKQCTECTTHLLWRTPL